MITRLSLSTRRKRCEEIKDLAKVPGADDGPGRAIRVAVRGGARRVQSQASAVAARLAVHWLLGDKFGALRRKRRAGFPQCMPYRGIR